LFDPALDFVRPSSQLCLILNSETTPTQIAAASPAHTHTHTHSCSSARQKQHQFAALLALVSYVCWRRFAAIAVRSLVCSGC
jgi:hypothetical protein